MPPVARATQPLVALGKLTSSKRGVVPAGALGNWVQTGVWAGAPACQASSNQMTMTPEKMWRINGLP